VVERLDKTYQAFFQRIKKGETSGFPRFKPESRYRSFTYPQSGFSLEGKHLKLSKIGRVRIRRHRQMEEVVKTCSIVQKNGKYYACLVVEVQEKALPKTGKEVGVDLGIAHLAITSEEQFFSSPKYLRKSEAHLKQLQRSVSRKKKGSGRRRKEVSLLAKWHEKVANQRRALLIRDGNSWYNTRVTRLKELVNVWYK
jgi:putative transposase